MFVWVGTRPLLPGVNGHSRFCCHCLPWVFWGLFPGSSPVSVLSLTEIAIVMVLCGHPVHGLSPLAQNVAFLCSFSAAGAAGFTEGGSE